MRDQYKRFAKHNVFPVLSILLAVYFFYAFSLAVGVPPAPSLDWPSTAYLVLAVVFFFAPEVQRFETTKLHDYETRLDEAKGELLLLKSQLRTVISAYNGLLTSPAKSANQPAQASDSMSSTGLPSPEAADEASQELDSALGEESEQKQLDAEIEYFLSEEDFDIESALWDMRKVMDKELRRVVGHELAAAGSNGNVRQLSSRALFDDFAGQHSEYAGMQSAFDYVLQVCDAAAHGREVPAACAVEAFQMGFRMLDALRKIMPAQASHAA